MTSCEGGCCASKCFMFSFTVVLALKTVGRQLVAGEISELNHRGFYWSSRMQKSNLVWSNPFHDIMEGLAAKRAHESHGACPCCGFVGRLKKILHKDTGNIRADGECPVCGARERHRACCYELAKLVPAEEKFRLLHFGPQLQMENQIARMVQVDQISMDFFQTTSVGHYKYSKNTLFGDVTNLPLPNSFVDGIILLHVLEHVPALATGLAELHRVLREDGWMILEVPCSANMQRHRFCGSNSTFSERVKCAGQNDHYWRLSCKQFLQQTEDAGFSCKSASCSQWNDAQFRARQPHLPWTPHNDRDENLSSICGRIHHRGISLKCVKSVKFPRNINGSQNVMK